MSDYNKLTDEQLDEYDSIAAAAQTSDRMHPWVPTIRALIAELRELRKLRAEVEPVLRRAAQIEKECRDSGNEFFNTGATNLLARHFGKEPQNAE